MHINFFTVFACILRHFYLVDDIYDTKLTFSYQYFIIYSVWYEYPICVYIPDISPDIRYPIWKTPIRYDPDIRYLEPWWKYNEIWDRYSWYQSKGLEMRSIAEI